MEVDHGCRLYVLLPEHLHLHRSGGELVGEVVQEVREVGRRSVNDPHHERGRLGLVLAERQGHKLLSEALHLGRRQRGELLAVGVRHRRPPVGLLLHLDQATELQTGQARRRGAVERGVVAKPVPDHGGDGGGGSGRILVVLLWSGGGVEEAAAAAAAAAAVTAAVVVVVPIDSTEELGQTQRHP